MTYAIGPADQRSGPARDSSARQRSEEQRRSATSPVPVAGLAFGVIRRNGDGGGIPIGAINKIGVGHAWKKHVVELKDFPNAGYTFKNTAAFIAHIKQTVATAVENQMTKPLRPEGGRKNRVAYWAPHPIDPDGLGTVVIHDPETNDRGTSYPLSLRRYEKLR